MAIFYTYDAISYTHEAGYYSYYQCYYQCCYIVRVYLSQIEKTEGRDEKILIIAEMFGFIVIYKDYLFSSDRFRQIVESKLRELYEDDWEEASDIYHQLYGKNLTAERSNIE
jgi:hypothetical protein